ncbi:MAG: [protein-PII] uridylyltransferase [Kofleriaceae bacterium]
MASSLRGILDATFADLAVQLRRPQSGAAAARAIADVYDRELALRFAAAREGISAPLALVATGGWARRDLAPYSDIDFIVLHDRDEAAAKQLSDRLLYPLWDEKLAIGHAVREPRATARLAKGDLATATAMVDARFIAGDRALAEELVRATLATLAPSGNPNDFIGALAAESHARHDRFGAAIYVLEPNLKQGIGALRDVATALWAAGLRWVPPHPEVDPPVARELIASLVELGRLTPRQAALLDHARDFQLRLRALVQLAARRRFDQLTFELQEQIGPALYPDAHASGKAAVAPAVEALMREYYLHARGVVQVTERLLETARVPPRSRSRTTRTTRIDATLVTCNGELAFADPSSIAEQPSELVRLFRVALATGLPIAGDTKELVAEQLARDPAPLARDLAAARLVLEALVDLRDGGVPSLFELMHQLGILGAVMPGWAPCTARVQHDLYHVYTVDQHQLLALAMQKQLARGELAAEHPLATELWQTVRPAPVLLATLLHDVGKPLGKGHAEKGAVIAEQVAIKLGLAAGDAETVAFLVRQHLTMAHLSQRRDLSDPDVIARFAERVGSEERLAELYLVTLCDTAMTAPDNLSAWKDDLLRALMMRTRAHFRGESLGDLGTGRDPRAEPLDPAARAILDGIDPRLLVQLTSRQAVRHALLAARTSPEPGGPRVGLEIHCFPMKGHSELAIVAPDMPGVLAAIAGTLTAHRVDVLGAILGHGAPSGADATRLVLDVFFVRDLKGAAIPDDDPRWPRLLDDLRTILASRPDPRAVAELITRRRPPSGLPPRVTPGVTTEIKLHDDSLQATIVEVSTRDRVGVLYAITHTLAELGLDISLAKIATEGEKVADVFYVTRGGRRLTEAGERDALIARLYAAVEQPEGER